MKTKFTKSMSSLNKKSLLLWVVLFLCGQFISAQSQPALDIAQKHLQENVKALNLSPADLEDYKVQDNYVSAHNGVTHLYLIQKHQGIEVYNGMININILPNGKVLNLGNRFIADLQSRVNTTSPQISAKQAVEKVIQHFNVITEVPYVLAEAERVNDQEIIFTHQGIALEPIKTKLYYQPLEDKSVRLVWQVNLYEENAQNWWNARIDAITGELVAFNNQVIKCNFGHSAEECHVSHNHNHTATSTALVDDEVNNAYNVIPLGFESPNHGPRVLQVAPADLTASPFGWHDTDGVEGHDYTITRGNNVHAYHDIFNLNTSSGDEPDGGDSLFFDFPFDENNNSPYTQIDAATSNLFYWNNMMHDVWYQYGFDEVSGNFQANNYTNGGEQGDYVRAECLDGSGTNNANFGTGADGSVGRMQMFFWGNGTPPTGGEATLEVTAPETVAGDYPMVPGGFGGDIPDVDSAINGSVVLVDDGTAPNSDACEGLVNIAEINGNIALIDRGACEFGFKILAAENAGAIAAIICNNIADAPIVMAPGAVGAQVTIPAVMISLQDCNTLKTDLEGLEISLFDSGITIPMPGPTGIDGDFDSGIICHEYGHGVSIRLTGGPNTGGCLGNNEQMGEGWSDWFGLVLSSTSANNADEGRGIGTYATNEPITGGGIRTFRYSRNMTINPHTYADINGESIPHGVGSVWCAMIWDLYWDLIDVYGYDDDMHNGTGGNNIAMQLVIDGLKLQACDPNFIDGRDAILAADEANYDGANQCLIWETFARRGLGVDAQAGGNENFDVPLLCSNSVGIEKTGAASAEVLDEISYTIEVTNGTQIDLTEYTITDILPSNTTYVDGSSTCGGTVDNGVLTMVVENIASLQSSSCTYSVTINAGVYSQIGFEDDLENGLDQWEISGTGAAMWAASTVNPNSGTTSVFAPNPATESDQYFMIAESYTLSGDPGLGFYHSYDTEEDWDGGVVEIRLAGTNTWFDLGNAMLSNGYNSLITENDASAISGRPAFHGNSGGYVYTLVDLSLYSNAEVDIRFRFASDGAVGGDGWHVDDIQIFSNLVNIENVACVTDQDGDEICASAQTTVFGVISSNENITANDARVALFPNPTDSRFSVEVTTEFAQDATIKVYTTDGKLIFADKFNTSDPYTANMAKYGTGVYFAEIITNELQTVKKLVVR
jgi:uncharacterized repeat protein (TIGR01451 family)